MVYTEMGMINRQQFTEYFEQKHKGLSELGGPLWIPEDFDPPIKCVWFICVNPIINGTGKTEYWEWCDKNMRGYARCFSSSVKDRTHGEEWWGFTDSYDIPFWVLRWA
jgi:hypothetical protein